MANGDGLISLLQDAGIVGPNPPGVNQNALDAAALGTAAVPGLGDVVGTAADLNRYANEPESRTPTNFLLTAAGVLPFIPSASSARSAKELSEAWERAGVPNHIADEEGILKLIDIKVPEEIQGKGVGTRFMEELNRFADQSGKPVKLQPVTDLSVTRTRPEYAGTDADKLEEFYRRFGFEREPPNKYGAPPAMRRDPK